MRSLFVTKTAFSAYLLASAGMLQAFWPDAVPWVNSHAGLIMVAAAATNLVIRKLTHDKVALFPSAGE